MDVPTGVRFGAVWALSSERGLTLGSRRDVDCGAAGRSAPLGLPMGLFVVSKQSLFSWLLFVFLMAGARCH